MPLYLLPSGRFAFFGVWHRFEYTSAAGTWTRSGDNIQLGGLGRLRADTGGRGGVFERHFTRSADGTLTGMDVKGWSLLSWTGPYVFQGAETFVDLRGSVGPADWAGLEGWIDTFLAE